MPSNKHADVRYKVLDDCFSNKHRHYYFSDLLEKCNEELRYQYGESGCIGVRTLRSDIKYMRQQAQMDGVYIDATDDGNGDFYYEYSDPEFSIYKRGLSPDNLAQLRETILMLQRFKGLPDLGWMSEVLVKLEDKLELHGSKKSVIGFEENKSYSGLDWIQSVFEAIINQVPQKVSYRTFNDVEYEWILSPHYLKEYNNRWFLVGINHDGNRVTTVALDRIDEMEPIHETYLTSAIDFESYFDDVVGVSVYQERHKETIRLRFAQDSPRFFYVQTKMLHHSQVLEDLDNRIVRIEVIPNNELDALILSFGKDVEVLSPPEYRAHIQNIVRQSYEHYFPKK